MPKDTPDHHDAELALRAYELRRETVMRESRNALAREFWPRSYEDVLPLTKADHPLNAAFRQVASYWEIIYGFARHGVVEPEFWAENNGEGIYLFAKVAPYLEEYRKDYSPNAFRNAEWVSRQTAKGRELFAMFTARVRKVLETK